MDKITQELKGLGISVSANTVARLLKQMDYSLRVNHKEIAFHSSEDRNEQFEWVNAWAASIASTLKKYEAEPRKTLALGD